MCWGTANAFVLILPALGMALEAIYCVLHIVGCWVVER